MIRAEQELKNKQGKPLGPIKDVIGAQARESVKIQTDHALQVLRYLIYVIAMPDVQNFFHKALAVIFAKVQYLYFRRKLSASSIE